MHSCQNNCILFLSSPFIGSAAAIFLNSLKSYNERDIERKRRNKYFNLLHKVHERGLPVIQPVMNSLWQRKMHLLECKTCLDFALKSKIKYKYEDLISDNMHSGFFVRQIANQVEKEWLIERYIKKYREYFSMYGRE